MPSADDFLNKYKAPGQRSLMRTFRVVCTRLMQCNYGLTEEVAMNCMLDLWFKDYKCLFIGSRWNRCKRNKTIYSIFELSIQRGLLRGFAVRRTANRSATGIVPFVGRHQISLRRLAIWTRMSEFVSSVSSSLEPYLTVIMPFKIN